MPLSPASNYTYSFQIPSSPPHSRVPSVRGITVANNFVMSAFNKILISAFLFSSFFFFVFEPNVFTASCCDVNWSAYFVAFNKRVSLNLLN